MDLAVPMDYWHSLPALTLPGLFVTATDTGVGKTVVSCAIARALRQRGVRLGVSKPFSSGCDRLREGLVNPDTEALAHFADCREPLDVINPVRYRAPLAPGVAAEESGERDASERLAAVRSSLLRLSARHEAMLFEGAGGVLVPLDGSDPRVTVLSLISALGYPAVVVARAGLGTLNHTSLTVWALRESGCTVAGVVLNGYQADAQGEGGADPSMATNRRWIERMTGAPVLAQVPRVADERCRPWAGQIDEAVLSAVGGVDWQRLMRPPVAGAGSV